MNKSKQFTLRQYSCMAGVLILCSDSSNAEAVYTNVEPDIEIQFDGQTAVIDMDNNGAFDFAFLKTSGGYAYGTFTSSEVYRFRRRIWAGPQIITNEIAGEMVTHGAGYGTTYFPYALISSDWINSDLSFQYWGYQIMAWGFYQSSSDWNDFLGKWSPDIDSAYLGVRFWGDDNCMHYGWVRCTTFNLTQKLIIHDYAYESKCGTGIKAGDLIGDTTVEIEELLNLDATVYCYNSTVYISMSPQLNFADIEVYDLTGKIIYSNKIVNEFTQIKMNEPKGMYIVKLIAGENKLVKKIYVN